MPDQNIVFAMINPVWKETRLKTQQSGLNQIIKEPTNILNISSPCTELILSSQPHLIIESVVHSYLHLNWHRQIVYVKFNLQIIYPPHYHYEQLCFT